MTIDSRVSRESLSMRQWTLPTEAAAAEFTLCR